MFINNYKSGLSISNNQRVSGSLEVKQYLIPKDEWGVLTNLRSYFTVGLSINDIIDIVADAYDKVKVALVIPSKQFNQAYEIAGVNGTANYANYGSGTSQFIFDSLFNDPNTEDYHIITCLESHGWPSFISGTTWAKTMSIKFALEELSTNYDDEFFVVFDEKTSLIEEIAESRPTNDKRYYHVRCLAYADLIATTITYTSAVSAKIKIEQSHFSIPTYLTYRQTSYDGSLGTTHYAELIVGDNNASSPADSPYLINQVKDIELPVISLDLETNAAFYKSPEVYSRV